MQHLDALKNIKIKTTNELTQQFSQYNQSSSFITHKQNNIKWKK